MRLPTLLFDDSSSYSTLNRGSLPDQSSNTPLILDDKVISQRLGAMFGLRIAPPFPSPRTRGFPSTPGRAKSLDQIDIRCRAHNFLQFIARDDHRVSHRFFVRERKGKRHVLIELLQARDIGTALSQDLAHFFRRFEKVVVPE